MIKKYLIIVGLISFLLVSFKLYFEYNEKKINNLNKEITTIKTNNDLLISKIKEQNENINEFITDIKNQKLIIEELQKKQIEIKNNFSKLKLKNDNRNYDKIAEKKEKLFENVINKSIKDYNKEILNLTK